MSHDELPKVIDKSQADIDTAIATIKASEIEGSTKDFAISCIKLAVWLPKALLEHKIKLSNLRKLIFGLGRKNKKRQMIQRNPTQQVTLKIIMMRLRHLVRNRLKLKHHHHLTQQLQPMKLLNQNRGMGAYLIQLTSYSLYQYYRAPTITRRI